jgi:hypothetical protein
MNVAPFKPHLIKIFFSARRNYMASFDHEGTYKCVCGKEF